MFAALASIFWLMSLGLPAPSTPSHALVDVATLLPVRVDLKYATTDNFMGKDVYGDWRRCLLVDDAALMLQKAHAALQREAPHLTFILYDCARPRSVQIVMWDAVKGTKHQGYVANPHAPPGSVHNRGCAVDLSIWDTRTAQPLDMGTPFDFFGAKAEPRREAAMLQRGQLSAHHIHNRELLRRAMVSAGFRGLAHEWWHFDCKPASQARQQYPLIEQPQQAPAPTPTTADCGSGNPLRTSSQSP